MFAVLRIHSRENVSTTGCYLYDGPSGRFASFLCNLHRMSYNPKRQASWFGLCSVSLAATQEIAFAFFLQVLRCFSSWSVFLTLCIQIRIPYHYVWWVSFGNLRIKAYLQLPKHIGVSPSFIDLVSRHPPCALSNLTKLKIKKYELHCYLVFKEHTYMRDSSSN